MKQKMIILLAALSLTACKSTYDVNREAALAAKPITNAVVQDIIDNTTPINIEEDQFQGEQEYVDQALYSAARQIIDLQMEPRYLSLEVTLTPEMYNGDWNAFAVALDSQWLLEKGAIDKPLEDFAILSTNNLYNSHTSDHITYGKYNRQILRGMAVAAIDTPISDLYAQTRGMRGGKNPLTEKQDKLTWLDFMGFTDDVEKNVYLMSSLITQHNRYGRHVGFSHHKARPTFDPVKNARKSYADTKRAATFIKADAVQAREMIGNKYYFVFVPGAAFEIKTTGQKIVIAQTKYTTFTDENLQPIRLNGGKIKPSYYWVLPDKSFEKGFTAEHTKAFIKADTGDEPF